MKTAFFVFNIIAVSSFLNSAQAAAVYQMSPAEKAVRAASIRYVQDESKNAAVELQSSACGKNGILVSFPAENSSRTYLVVSEFFGTSVLDVITCK